MELAAIQSLGDRIEKSYRKVNFDEALFPDIAAEALAESHDSFDLKEAISLLFRNQLPYRDNFGFSSLPITIYSSNEFFIEILIWTSASTAIHEHSFSGAFKVLTGSSFHAKYSFIEEQRISQLLSFGQINQESSTLTRPGDIQKIEPGKNGLVHSLYHLVQPSATMVVRTVGKPWLQPQRTLFKPGIALARLHLERDPQVNHAWHTYSTIASLDSDDLWLEWINGVTKMDLPRIAAVCDSLSGALAANSGLRSKLLTAIFHEHGTVSAQLDNFITQEAISQEIISLREAITDKDLRYFLALLLNNDSREYIFRLVRDSYSEEASELCAQWIYQLGDPEPLLSNVYEMNRKIGAASAPPKFLLKLIKGRRINSKPAVINALKALVSGQNKYSLSESESEVFQYYQAIPELAVFNNDVWT